MKKHSMSYAKAIQVLTEFNMQNETGIVLSDAIEYGIRALEKQVPKAPITKLDDEDEVYAYCCPCCGYEHDADIVDEYRFYNCEMCGQRLNWGEIEDDYFATRFEGC